MPGAIILQSNRFTHWSNFIVSTRCWCLEVSSVARKEVKVFYIDYGNCEWISWDQFTDIHKRFWDLAPQAIPFKLAGELNFWWFLNPNVLSLFVFILLLKGGVAISPCSLLLWRFHSRDIYASTQKKFLTDVVKSIYSLVRSSDWLT